MKREEYQARVDEIAARYDELITALYAPVYEEAARLGEEAKRMIDALGPEPWVRVHVGDYTDSFSYTIDPSHAIRRAREDSGDWTSAAWIEEGS